MTPYERWKRNAYDASRERLIKESNPYGKYAEDVFEMKYERPKRKMFQFTCRLDVLPLELYRQGFINSRDAQRLDDKFRGLRDTGGEAQRILEMIGQTFGLEVLVHHDMSELYPFIELRGEVPVDKLRPSSTDNYYEAKKRRTRKELQRRRMEGAVMWDAPTREVRMSSTGRWSSGDGPKLKKIRTDEDKPSGCKSIW